MKTLLRLALAALAVAAFLLAGIWYQLSEFSEENVLNAETTVVIAPGASVRSTLSQLMTDGVVANNRLWRPWLRLYGRSACVQAGEIALLPPLTPSALLEQLCAAQPLDVIRVTIPEGLTQWHVADLLAENGVSEGDAFLAITTTQRPLPTPGFSPEVHPNGLDGYLFPDTYEFRRDTDPADVVARLVEHAQTVHGELRATHGPGPYTSASLSWYEVLILASMVEREAAVAEERPRIARVFLNRLQIQMMLQSDPTCVYSETNYATRPTRALCRDNANEYSTYVIPRLPPTPIATPGRAAIEAVLSPSDDPGLLYFVSMEDGTGRHAFAATLAAHNANVQRYQRSGQ